MTQIKRKIAHSLATVLLLTGMSACSLDVFEAPEQAATDQYAADTQLVLEVALPGSVQSATRAESDATSDECAITSLKMLAFSEYGTFVTRDLQLADSRQLADDGAAVFEIKNLDPGNYKVYVVANIPETLLADVKTEQQLRQVVLDYSETLPEPGKLPMIYEPGAMTNIPAQNADSFPVVQTLSMQFACVKVKYDLVFDKGIAECSEVFGANGLLIDAIKAERVSKSSKLISETTYLPEGRTVTLQGQYFDAYTNTPANASVNNADVLQVSGTGTAVPSAPAQKWVYQGVAYLPERYAADADLQTRLVIDASCTDAAGIRGNAKCRYTIALGGHDGDDAQTSLPRDTYYEVIGWIKSLGSAELSASVFSKSWMESTLQTSFVSTYLKLSKTEMLAVTSLDNDEISYETDGRGGVTVECESKLPVSGTTPTLIFVHDTNAKKITIKANPAIDIASVPTAQRTGTAHCWIKAGNIKKRFSVAYNIVPFFTIEPVAVKIQWADGATEAQRTAKFEYRTNLGGLLVTANDNMSDIYFDSTHKGDKTVTISGKSIKLSCTDPSNPVGELTVVAQNNPGTTLLYDFDAYPGKYSSLPQTIKDELSNSGKLDLSVTVMPPLGGYRIYFRAINDYHVGHTASADTGEFLYNSDGNAVAYPTEGTSNWLDFWDCEGKNSNRNDDRHRIYIYTQLGETTGIIITSPVWQFTYDYGAGAAQMTGDNQNPGWYYYDLPQNQSAVSSSNTESLDADTRNKYSVPRPGETLLIFYNKQDLSYGYTLHRASHHLDPGISLFDYEDREGYVLYDPTSEPYYYIFDDKPVVEDVTYTIYSDKKVGRWYKQYGNAAAAYSTNTPYTVWSEHINYLGTVTKNGTTYHKCTIKLKAPRGEYAKALQLQFLPPKQRVYLGIYDSDWYGSAPRIYIYKDGVSEYTTWANSPYMTAVPGTDNHVYYYDIPAGYESGRVIFRNNAGSQQIPGASNPGYLMVSGHSKITYTNNVTYWKDYYEPQSQTMLFSGRAYPGNTGYYKSETKKWSKNP